MEEIEGAMPGEQALDILSVDQDVVEPDVGRPRVIQSGTVSFLLPPDPKFLRSIKSIFSVSPTIDRGTGIKHLLA